MAFFPISTLLSSAFSHWILQFFCPLNKRNSKYLLSSSCLGNYGPRSSHPLDLLFDKILDWLNKFSHCTFSSVHFRSLFFFNIKTTKRFQHWMQQHQSPFPCSILQLIHLKIILLHIWNTIILGYSVLLLLIRKLKTFNLGYTEERDTETQLWTTTSVMHFSLCYSWPVMVFTLQKWKQIW